jgi:hypothetical protein
MYPTPPRGREILRFAQDDRGFAQDDRREAFSTQGPYVVGIASLAVRGDFASSVRDS